MRPRQIHTSFLQEPHTERCRYEECGKEFTAQTAALYCCAGHQQKQHLINMRKSNQRRRAKANEKSDH